MRGYGETDQPDEIENYTLLHLLGDMVGLLDVLGIETAVIAGHDWAPPWRGTPRFCAPTASGTNPDGTFIDRNAFLSQIGRGSSVKNIREHDVVIRILGDFAIIHARTSYQKQDGTQGAGRYTDDWQFRDGRWQCVSAHVTRL
jgi:hypothetical protein